MRLLKRVASADSDSFSLTLEEHGGSRIPPYAILSHCWGASNDEVSYADLMNISPEILAKRGYNKILKSMEMAALDGFEYLWVDTCCIDKSSSSELSEGINSMFAWYRDAAVCYAYLNDVRSGFEDPQLPTSEFRASRWFTRGWTLQELIAPRSVIFVAKNWMEIGTKRTLVAVVAEITNIDQDVLLQQNDGLISLAKKMSWASNRQTTRIEDRAYSLLGLFDVNMPTIYGEGQKAFWRLQNEILKVSDDHTIFAYGSHSRPFGPEFESRFQARTLSGMLAESPDEFEDSSDYLPLRRDARYFDWYRQSGLRKEMQPHQMTNVGFSITLPILHLESQDMPDSFLQNPISSRHWRRPFQRKQCLAMIACEGPSRVSATCIALCWFIGETNQYHNRYWRSSWGGQSTLEVNLDVVGWDAFEYKQIYIVGAINENDGWRPWSHSWDSYRPQVNVNFHPPYVCQMIDTVPLGKWANNCCTIVAHDYEPLPESAMRFRLLDTAEIFFTILGVSKRKLWCYMEICEDGRNAQEMLDAYKNNHEEPFRHHGNSYSDYSAVTSIRTLNRKIVMRIQINKHFSELCTARITVYDDHEKAAVNDASGRKYLKAA